MTKQNILRIGVDTGGTFTDVILDPGFPQALITHKLLSTPEDPAQAVLSGIQQILSKYLAQSNTQESFFETRVVHGSTVATNALLERKGARTAFITTDGFQDTLRIARQNRPELYALQVQRPEPPVSKEHCFGVKERILFNGEVKTPLSTDDCEELLEQLQKASVESIAVSFLHSYINPLHEKQLGASLRQAFPDLHITLSHELLPEFREYERASTCIVNAVVAPPMNRYLRRLQEEVGQDLRIMASAGGSLPTDKICEAPIQTILSGPAGGVVGAFSVAKEVGIENIITLDMGGTSTDVALCKGELTRTTEGEIGDLPVRLPTLDIHTVGAGGGSIAWLDPGGALRVGPHSVGAEPGPACYGRQDGPLQATVTDAHVVLGHLPVSHPLGGRIHLQPQLAHDAILPLADAIGLSVEEVALGILQVAEATMARAVQRISLQKGHDPRHFVLMPFGGAGGFHACRLAEHLGMERVFVPRYAGLLSALGMLWAPPLYAFSSSVMLRVEACLPEGQTSFGGIPGEYPDLPKIPDIQKALETLVQQADVALKAEDIPATQQSIRTFLDVRYVGQSYEITIPLEEGSHPLQTFLDRHQALYGYLAPGKAIEVVTVRAQASASFGHVGLATEACAPSWSTFEVQESTHQIQPKSEEASKQVDWCYLQYEELQEDKTYQGPVIISSYSSTTIIPDGWSFIRNALGHIFAQREAVSS